MNILEVVRLGRPQSDRAMTYEEMIDTYSCQGCDEQFRLKELGPCDNCGDSYCPSCLIEHECPRDRDCAWCEDTWPEDQLVSCEGCGKEFCPNCEFSHGCIAYLDEETTDESDPGT